MTLSPKRCRRILTITLNPAIDRTVILDSFEYGAINRAASSNEDMGGKGINVARMLNLCDADVVAAGLIGADNEAITEVLLARENFSIDLLAIAGKTRTNTKIVSLNDRQTTDLNEPGFDLNEVSDWIIDTLITKVKTWAENFEIVVFAGSLPPGLATDTYASLIRAFQQSNPECFTVADAEGEILLEALKAGVDMIKPNGKELASITGLAADEKASLPDQIAACRKLIDHFGLSRILLSNGSSGAALIVKTISDDVKTDVYLAPAIDVEPISTTGAGDSLLAGYLSAMCEDLDNRTCLARAVACGALAVSRKNWQSLSAAKITEYTEAVFSKIRQA